MATTSKKLSNELRIEPPGVDVYKSPLPLKQTAPGVISGPIGKYTPSRPQNKQSMGVGGSKARMRHKGRVDPKAADPHDPAKSPLPPRKVHWPTQDKKAKAGYVKNRKWPVSNKKTAEMEPSDSYTAAHP
jgi:hypothetical protein